MKKIEIVLNDTCLESEELKQIINYLEKKEDVDLKMYNEDYYKDRKKASTLKYRYSAKLIPLIHMEKELPNKKIKVRVLYTENNDIQLNKVMDFVTEKTDNTYKKVYTEDGILFGKYYPDIDRFIKI